MNINSIKNLKNKFLLYLILIVIFIMENIKRIELNNTKNEIIGIYDENDNYVRKDTRKNMRKNNLIHRCTDIVVLNEKNEILVQTRSITKEYCPGYLDAVVGGVVGDGEDVDLCAEREVKEEIGIDVNKIKEKLKFIKKHFFEEDICRVWTYCYLLKLNEDNNRQIRVDLSKIPANIERIAFTCTIYDAEAKGQDFSKVDAAFISLTDQSSNKEIIHYDLGKDFSTETALVAGEIYKHKNQWKFNAIGSGFSGGLKALCSHYGIEVEN